MVEREEACVWKFPDCPFRIECTLSVLEQMNAEVTDAFCSVPRGGAETGGVLYGTHDDSSVRILAAKPLKCEHAFGPSFTLSDSDLARLAASLELPKTDPRLAGMAVVGWYHSHTRSDISFTDADLGIHRKLFSQPWQIAVVLRPMPAKPTRLGVFYCLADGSIISNGAPVEYSVAPRLRARGAAADRAENSADISGLRAESQGQTETMPYRRRQSLHRPAYRRRHEAPRRRRPALWGKTRHQPPAAMEPDARTASASSGVRRWVIPALLGCLGLTAAYVAIHAQHSRREPPSAALNLLSMDRDGQLYIAWDREAVADAVNGVLQIKDGEERKTFAMDRESIGTGWIGYLRKSEVVSVSLMLSRKDGSKLRGYTNYVPGERAASRLPEWVPVPPPSSANPIAPVNAVPFPSESAAPPARTKPLARERRKPPRHSSSGSMAEPSHAVMRPAPERRVFEPPVTRRSQAHWILPPPVAPAPVPNNSISLPAVAVAAPPPERISIAGSWTSRGVRTPRAPSSITTGMGWQRSTGVQESGSLYPPKSVEVSIFEKGGEIFGSLVGRYRTPKSTGLGPDVTFTFRGAPQGGSSMRFPWTGANGARGEVELIRLPQSPDAMRIVWYPEGHKPVFDHVLLRMKAK